MDPSPASSTVISDLNGDCLMETFKYLDFIDLCAAADVCRLFRQSAQRHFAYSALKNVDFYSLCFKRDATCYTENLEKSVQRKKLRDISRVLRLFGFIIKSIKMSGHLFDFVTKAKYVKAVFGLMNRYCGASLIELELVNCHLTYDIALSMRPLFRNLQKLTLCDSSYVKLFARMISMWSPELRELHFSYQSKSEREIKRFNKEMPFDDILYRPFPNLKSISFRRIFNVTNTDLDEFLRSNPQLKCIKLLQCQHVDGSIFQSIAKHAPTIEHIQIDEVNTMSRSSIKHFSELKSLTTLTLCTTNDSSPMDDMFMLSILDTIRAAQIPLRNLYVLFAERKNFQKTGQLVEAISKLQTLNCLGMKCVPDFNYSHILGLCKQLKELSELNLHENGLTLTAANLLEMVKHAKNLKLLRFHDRADSKNQNEIHISGKLYDIDILAGVAISLPNSDRVPQIREGNKISVLTTYMRKLRASSERERLINAYDAKIESLQMDKAEKDVDAYLQIAQLVGQRPKRIPLQLELNPGNPLGFLTNIPKEYKCNDVLAVEVKKSPAVHSAPAKTTKYLFREFPYCLFIRD